MNKNTNVWNVNIRKTGGYLLLIAILVLLLSVSFVASVPTAPLPPTYISNTTYTSGLTNRSNDIKGTITTIVLSATQQDYKWKAYVGNVSGTLALADANGNAIYNWVSATATGEIYVSRFSNINWNNAACADNAAVNTEQNGLSMSGSAKDNINSTFNYTTHFAFQVGTTPISGCKSTATYVNNNPQVMASANFQEALLRDTGTGNLVYAGLVNASSTGYNGQKYDFQMIVGENESSNTPTPYFFWVELG
jgi:hypothetical protein